jgi:predicted transcriptional regulator
MDQGRALAKRAQHRPRHRRAFAKGRRLRKTTTYTVIRKCLEKGIVAKEEPDFLCQPLVTREQVQQIETADLLDKLYDGAPDRLIASLLDSQKLSPEQISRLKRLVAELE